MTVDRGRRRLPRHRRRARVPARRAPRRRSRAPRTSRTCRPRTARRRRRAHARARGSRRRPAVPPARGGRARIIGTPSDARPRPVQARRAQAGRPHGAGRGAAGRWAGRDGPFRLELVRMAHSIPDNAGVVVEVGGQRIFHTSDYKVDHTPIDGFKTDVGRLAELGNLGVDLLLGDSTNAERPGLHRLGAARRRGVPADHPVAQGADTRRLVRLERPPHAAGGRRRPRVRPQGVRRRPVDAQEPQHRARRSATWRCPTMRS